MVLRRLFGRNAEPNEQQAIRTAVAVASAPEYLWPYWLERQLRPTSNAYRPVGDSGRITNTTGRNAVALGTMGSGVAAFVDPRGLIDTGAGWSLDWWVGADDRWHVPAREVNVRQARIGPGPLIETSLRIPGGNAVQRCWAVEGRGGEKSPIVVEFENRSGSALALAIAVRPYGVLGAHELHDVRIDGQAIIVDGLGRVDVARPPGAAVVGGAASDPFHVVTAGDAASAGGMVQHHDAAGLASAVVVLPLPHHATLRVVVSPGSAELVQTDLAALPEAEQIAAGWAAHADAGPALSLPEDGVAAAFAAAANRVLIALADTDRPEHGRVAHTATRLGRSVIPDVLPRWQRRTPERSESWALLALCRDALTSPPPSASDPGPHEYALVEELLPFIVDAIDNDASIGGMDRSPLAAMLKRLGQPALPEGQAAVPTPSGGEITSIAAFADNARHRLGVTTAIDDVRWALQAGGNLTAWPDEIDRELGRGSGGQPDAAVAAAAMVDLLLAVAAHDTADGIIVLPEYPDAWYGQSVDVSNVAMASGRLSFAVRWHGPRPALLWEREPWPGETTDVVLRCPALAPGWSTTEPVGEVLFEVPPSAPEQLAEPVVPVVRHASPSAEDLDAGSRAEPVEPKAIDLTDSDSPDTPDGGSFS